MQRYKTLYSKSKARVWFWNLFTLFLGNANQLLGSVTVIYIVRLCCIKMEQLLNCEWAPFCSTTADCNPIYCCVYNNRDIKCVEASLSLAWCKAQAWCDCWRWGGVRLCAHSSPLQNQDSHWSINAAVMELFQNCIIEKKEHTGCITAKTGWWCRSVQNTS